ncbi:transposase, partial [Sporomusa ovata]
MATIPKEAIKELIKEQKFNNTTEVMNAIKDMFRDVLQEIMEAELETELGYVKQERRSDDVESGVSKNYRNGYSKKKVKTQLGEVEITIPRDRNGEYEPQIIGKYSRNVDGMEEKILSLYAAGLSIRDISEQIKSLYDVEISPELVSKISEKIMPQVTEWQNRPLEAVYPFVFL